MIALAIVLIVAGTAMAVSSVSGIIVCHVKTKRKRSQLRDEVMEWATEIPITGKDECAICLSYLAKGVRFSCGHEYHGACVLPWVRTKNTCPNCRRTVMAKDALKYIPVLR